MKRTANAQHQKTIMANGSEALAVRCSLLGVRCSKWHPASGIAGSAIRVPQLASGVGGAEGVGREGDAADLPADNHDGEFYDLASPRFAGFRFLHEYDAGGYTVLDEHWAWVDVNVLSDGSIQVGSVGYETVSGNPIPAGMPEPSSLAVLALGAAGLLGRRRR